jgi:enediyne biosynthesis thioesterase
MQLDAITQNRIAMLFEYWRRKGGNEELVARGAQQVACMSRDGASLVAAPLPSCVREALLQYA